MRFKKTITVLLCAAMSLSMLACGSIDMPDGGTGGIPNGPTIVGTKTYYVTFNGNGATNPSPIAVSEGKTIGSAQMPAPTRAGYSFVGWFDKNGKQYTGSTKITGNVELTAKWESDAAKLEYEKNISSWAKPGHLYIHYKKFTHVAAEQVTPPTSGTTAGAPNYNSAIDSSVYADWGLWAWPKKNANGRLFNAAWIDESGAVFDVDLTETYNDCGWDATKKQHQGVTNTFAGAEEIGTQIHQISTRTSGTGFWANDGGDNYLAMSKCERSTGDYHWFINEAHVKDGSPTYADVTYEDPYKDDPNRTLNATKLSGENIIANSAADNSSKYPLKNVSDEFNCSNGYQIFIASFADSDGDGMGDIQGIINKLDYLQSLNVDLLWLTPFQDSTDYHGYNINNYTSVDSRWGTKEKYRELISKAKDKGMKIVMDFVLNHTSLSNEWFVKSQTLVKEQNVKYESNDTAYAEVDYRQFYSWITQDQFDKLSATEKTHWYKDNYGYYFYSSFSSSMPELNYDYQPVRDAILDVCYEWMSAGLAGFRLDAVKHIYMCNEVKGKNSSVTYNPNREFKKAVTVQPNGQMTGECDYVEDNDIRFNYDMKRNLNFYREFNNRLKTKYPQAYVVGENLDGWDARTAPFYQGIDSQFDFSLYYNIPRGILHAEGVAGKFGDGLGAIYNRYNRGYQGYKTYNEGYIGGQFTSNHDLPRARDRVNVTNVDEDGDTFGSFYTNGSIDGKTHIYDSTDKLHKSITTTGTIQPDKITTTTERLKVYYAALMTLPGVTWLYYGDELGMSGLMQHTLTCTDSNLVTSSTASQPHEDVIYRQPMKWNQSTAAEYDEATHTSHGNAAFKIGYGEITCELVGINATDHIPSVAECTNTDGSFKNGTLIDWVAKLNKMRKEKGITGKSKLTLKQQGQDNCSYTVTGTNGSITVQFSTRAISGSSSYGLKFDGNKFHVLIS
ncbi:MAG: InlB B-repeat-containing protein [Clostridiales bacterium]|nr:InlB B-repeat-containing protein [Clostridiales bacterium]